MGYLITFEGGEGSGKTYQSKLLHRRLLEKKKEAIYVYEPGVTKIGEYIRRILKSNRHKISPEVELLLFSASRSLLVDEIIIPALTDNKIVICDRFADSTLVYQGYGRGMDIDLVTRIIQMTTKNIIPNLTVLLDIEPDIGLGRKKSITTDRFHDEDVMFHTRVREGFLKVAEENKQRWIVIDATLDRKEIAEAIWVKVLALIGDN